MITEAMQDTWNETVAAVDAATACGLDTVLHGPPGTGKTHLAMSHGVADPATISSVTFTDLMAMEELRGHWINTPDGFRWHDGPLTRAWRNGTRFVGNELHRASGEVLSFLLAALDDRDVAAMTLPSGETIRPQDGFHFIGTTNGEPDDLDEALRDRLLALPVRVPNPAAIAALPADLRDIAANAVTADDEMRRLSLRPFFYFAKMRERMDKDAAGRAVFADRWPDIRDTITLAASSV